MSQPEETPMGLVCAKADAPVTVKGSSFEFFCKQCSQRVMVAPSGQEILRKNPELIILCTDCVPTGWEASPAADPDTLVRELMDSTPNNFRRRN